MAESVLLSQKDPNTSSNSNSDGVTVLKLETLLGVRGRKAMVRRLEEMLHEGESSFIRHLSIGV